MWCVGQCWEKYHIFEKYIRATLYVSHGFINDQLLVDI